MTASDPMPLDQGRCRVSVIAGYVELCRELGVDAQPLLRRRGLDEQIFARPETYETYIPLTAVEPLLSDAANATRCPHFGLRLAERQVAPQLHPLALLAIPQQTLGKALQVQQSIFHLYTDGVVLDIRIEGDSVGYFYTPHLRDLSPRPQTMSMCAVFALKLPRLLCGPEFDIDAAIFPFPRPVDATPYRRHFGSRLEFGREASGIYFHKRWLDQPLASANPLLASIIAEQLNTRREAAPTTWPLQARRIIDTLLPTGHANAERVANVCGVSRRTLHRHLAESGTTFKTLLDDARFEAAKRLLETSDLPLIEIASLVGFADASAFSRAFRRRAGQAPIAHRRTATKTHS